MGGIIVKGTENEINEPSSISGRDSFHLFHTHVWERHECTFAFSYA